MTGRVMVPGFNRDHHLPYKASVRDRAARGSSWKLLACAGISVASPLALARHRAASHGIARHILAFRRHLAEARRPWPARCVATRLTDGTGRPLARHYYPPDAPSRATVPTAAARAPNDLCHGATGPSAVGPRHALLGLAPERRWGRRRHAYATHHKPQLRHKDASVGETRWVEARWLQRLHCHCFFFSTAFRTSWNFRRRRSADGAPHRHVPLEDRHEQ